MTQAIAQPQPQPAPVAPKPVLQAPAAEPDALERAVVKESFIPPKPVEPEMRPAAVAAPVVAPAEPFAAAAMTNGARQQPPRKVRGPTKGQTK